MGPAQISYSQLLIQFIQPHLSGTESPDDLLRLAKIGQLAWNFCVSDESTHGDDYLKMIVQELAQTDLAAKRTLDFFVLRWHNHFSQYKQYIVNVEIRKKQNGESTLYVESAPLFVLKN